MALINCPECGKQVSSLAPTCPHCGCPISISKTSSSTDTSIANNAVNNEISDLPSKTIHKRKSNKITFFIITLIVIAIGVATASYLYYQNQKKAEEEAAAQARLEEANRQSQLFHYRNDFDKAYKEIINNSIEAENCGILIRDVWYNTIFEKDDETTNAYTKQANGAFYDDFNDSLKVLFDDPTFSRKIQQVANKKDNVTDLIRKLNNPPEEYTKLYELLEKMYNAHLDFVNCVLNPQGNLEQFTNRFNDTSSAVVSSINAIQPYLK